MKEHWDRQTPYAAVSIDQLNAMIQPAFPGDHVVLHEILAGGLVNTIYKLTLNNFVQPVVLRLYTRDPHTCRKDIDLAGFVQTGVPLPRLYFGDPDAQRHSIPYTIAEFVAGPTLRDVLRRGAQNDYAGAMYAAGATLAALGRHTFECGGFLGHGLEIVQPLQWNAAELHWFVNDRLEHGGAAILGDQLAKQVRTFVQRHASLLDDLPITNALVHADYNEPNLIMQQHGGQWRVAAVLDWEYALAGPPLYDVGVMLRNAERWQRGFGDQFVQGFADGGGLLPPQWETITKLLDLINLCDFLSKATAGDAVARDVTALIARTIAPLDQAAA